MATGRVNVGGGGGNTSLNVFCQPTEPKIKEGIWIRSPNIEPVKDIIIDDEIYTNGKWVIGESFAPMINRRNEFGITQVNGKIYCIGGIGGSGGVRLNKVDIYDIKSNTWTMGANMPIELRSHCCVSVGNKIYCIGGSGASGATNILNIYDTTNNTWNAGAVMPSRRTQFGCVAVGDSIYCIGNNNVSGVGRNIDVYNTKTNEWSTASSMPDFRFSFGCALVETSVYCIGGGGKTLVTIYDTLTDTWKLGKPLPVARDTLSCVSVGNKIYCFGGRTTPGGITGRLDIYDTTNDTWSVGIDMITPRDVLGCVLYEDRIYCVGGKIDDALRFSDIVEVYSLIFKQYINGNIVIERQDECVGKYKTQMFNTKINITGVYSRFLSTFDNTWLFKNSKLQEYPTYYGNGIAWIKFKN